MSNIIITHADRDGLASAAVWLHEHSDIDQVIALRDPKDLGNTIRAIKPDVHRLFLFDLPFSWESAEALEEQYDHGSEILWIDHHLPAWKRQVYPVALTVPQRWKIVLPTCRRTTAVRMTMEWLWMLHNDAEMPYTYLKAMRVPGQYEIPKPIFHFLMEVCGVGEQTDRVLLLDAIEGLVRRGRCPSSAQLMRSLRMSIEGDHTLGEFEHGLAGGIRKHIAEVEAFFQKSNPDVWDVKDNVVFIKDPSVWPLRGTSRKNLSVISQKVTGAVISVIRHESNWAYIGLGHGQKIDLMSCLREIPGLDEGEGMVGHPYVVSMKGFAIEGQDDPVGYVADWLRDKLKTAVHA
jgi:hypothetical protein